MLVAFAGTLRSKPPMFDVSSPPATVICVEGGVAHGWQQSVHQGSTFLALTRSPSTRHLIGLRGGFAPNVELTFSLNTRTKTNTSSLLGCCAMEHSLALREPYELPRTKYTFVGLEPAIQYIHAMACVMRMPAISKSRFVLDLHNGHPRFRDLRATV